MIGEAKMQPVRVTEKTPTAGAKKAAQTQTGGTDQQAFFHSRAHLLFLDLFHFVRLASI